MKRTISLFLSAVMVLSCFFGLSFDAFAETLKNMGTINLDETKTIEIDDEDEIAYYTFTPSKTATYMYYSLSDNTVDPVGYIYKGEDVIAENDDVAMGCKNFCVSADLTAGVTYKLAGNIYDNETGSYDVTIEENPYKSISVDLAEPIQIIENADGYWDVDEDGNDYFCYQNYSNEIYREGNSITLTTNDDSTVVYTYDDEDGVFVNSEGDRLDFYYSSDQYENHWALGKNNYFTVEAFGLTADVPVEIIKNPYKSISVTLAEPIQIIENTDGEWDVDEDGNDYYEYDYSLYGEGNTITLTKSDDSTVIYRYNWDSGSFMNSEGDILDFYYSSDQYENHWTLGKNNYFTVEAFGLTTQVPVEIIQNPYKSISVTLAKPIQLVENYDGEWDVDENDNDFFCYYGYGIYREGNSITVTMKDNTKVVYTYDEDEDEFVNSKGEVLDFDYNSNQYSKHWTRGKNNSFTIEAFGLTTQVPVEIIENPVASISFVLGSPIQLIENVDGYTEYDDETGESYFYYDYSLYKEGNKLIIKYKNGKTETCPYVKSVYDFVNENGEEIYFDYNSNQYSKPWTLGKNNYITVEYMGAETQVPVEIVKNTVKAISFTPAKPIRVMENTFGWMEEDEDGNDYFEYGTHDYVYEKGAALTVTYTDNSTEKFVYNGDDFISQKTNKALEQYVEPVDDQYNNHWGVGTNYFTVCCYGKEAQVPVEVYEGNITSAEFIPVKPAKIMENTHGYYTEDDNDQRYFRYYTPYFNKGDIVRFTLGDGTKVDFVCVNTDDEATFYSEYFGRYWWFYSYSDQYDNHWTLGNNPYWISAFGEDIETTVEIISAEGHEHTWKEVVVKPTCCDKGYTYKRCEECGAEGEPYNYTDKTAHTYDSGTVLKAATATEEGKILYVCTRCGHRKTVTAPKLTPNTPITLTTPSIKKLKKGKKRFTAFWDKIPGVTRYEIQYSRNKKFKKGKKYGTKIKKVSANKSKITIKKLKKGKRYYVRIRAVKGTQVSPWSKVKKIKVK